MQRLFDFITKSDVKLKLLKYLLIMSKDKVAVLNIEYNQDDLEKQQDEILEITNLVQSRHEFKPQEQNKFDLSLFSTQNFIVNDLETFENCKNILLDEKYGRILGFDTESSTLPKFRLEIIQISNCKSNFIFDLKCSIYLTLLTFIVELFETHTMVGFNLMGKGDLNVLNKFLTWNNIATIPSDCKNIFDIKQFFQTHVCMDKELSFKKVAHHLGYKLCKYEQVSNWGMRPLRQSQLHYAFTESFMCLVV